MVRPMTNGELTDADDVNSEFLENDLDKILLVQDSLLSTSPTEAQFQSTGIDVGQGTTNLDETNSTNIWSDGLDGDADVTYCALSMDEFDDATIDTDIWTTATAGSGAVTETGGYLEVGSSAGAVPTGSNSSAIADQTNAIDFYDATIDNCIYFKYLWYGNSPGTSGNANLDLKIQLSNGSTHVTIREKVVTGSFDVINTTGTEYVKVNIDQSGDTMDVYINGALTHDNVDISSLGATGPYYLRLVSTPVTGSIGRTTTQYLRIYHVRYLDGTGTSDVYTDLVSTTGTIATGINATNPFTLNGGTIAYNLTADGTNYESVSLATTHRFTNTGTSAGAKFTVTFPIAPDATTEDNTPVFNLPWGIKWRAY